VAKQNIVFNVNLQKQNQQKQEFTAIIEQVKVSKNIKTLSKEQQ